MKIKRTEFYNFLQAISLVEDIKIEQFIFNFNPDGLKVVANIPNELGQVQAFISKDNIEDYLAYGEVGLDGISEIKQIYKYMKGDQIELRIKGSAMIINSENKQILKQLVNPMYIERVKEQEIPEYKSLIELSNEQIKSFRLECDKNKPTQIGLVSLPGELTISNYGKCVLNTKIKDDRINNEPNTLFDPMIIPLLSNSLSDCIVELMFGHTLPILIKFKKEGQYVQYIINPELEESNEHESQ